MTLHDHTHLRLAAAQQEPKDSITIITHTEMSAAYDQGLVKPLGRTVAYAVYYQDTWWIHFEGGWIRTDQALGEMLDTEAEHMTDQDAIIARNAAIRAASRHASPAGLDEL